MKVLSYKKKKSNLYNVSFDNGETLELYDDIILKYELLITSKISDKTYREVKTENSLLEAYYRALKYIGVRMRSEMEIRKYLKRYEYTLEERNYTVDRLKKEGYIDEERYAKSFLTDQINLTLNGPKKILKSLADLGISETIASKYIEEIDGSVWRDRIKKIIDKKAKVNKTSAKMFKHKVTSDLILNGYYSEDVHMLIDDYEIDVSDAFLKEANKIYNKLSTKYSGYELEMNFKSKMFSKGFNGDDISSFLREKDL